MALDLKGRQFGALQDALLDAFPSWNALEQLVEFELSESLERVAGKGRLEDVAFELIKWARARSRLDELLAGAMRRNPSNDELRSLGIELSLSSDEPPSGALEALVMPAVNF